MASIREIKLKIKTIKNIQQMTKAMKMVAAARLKRAQIRLESARPYARKIAEVTLDLAAATDLADHPLLKPHRDLNRVLILIFTGDRGMAGGFHQKIVDGAIQFAAKFQGQAEIAYYLFGIKGLQRMEQRRAPIYKRYEGQVAGVQFATIQTIAQELMGYYLNEEFDQIYLYYPKFKSAMTQRPRAFQLLPIDPSKSRQQEKHGLFLFEPGQKEILERIMPRYVESELYRAFLETAVGELGARMTAMSSATDNAAELIDRYQLDYNRIRQSQITKEIAEIVGGAESLRS